MITVSNLFAKYNKNKYVLNDVSLKIPYGVYGLIGENGAGKTTLLKILATAQNFYKGSIEVFGKDIKKDVSNIRMSLGYLPQKFDFFGNLTVYEVLKYFYEIKSIDKQNKETKINEIIECVNLGDKIHTKFKNLSGGMKQRVGIAQAIIGNPKIIILDEPTVGLDPSERIRFRNILNTISEDKIIIISTHIISDIAMICDNLAIMRNSKVLYQGNSNELTNSLEGKIFHTMLDKSSNINEIEYGKIISLEKIKGQIALKFIPKNIEIKKEWKSITPTLEDAYFYKINESGE